METAHKPHSGGIPGDSHFCAGIESSLRAFAATLITLDDPESDHRDHARKAMAGAKNDPLLAQNLGLQLQPSNNLELLTNTPAGGRTSELAN